MKKLILLPLALCAVMSATAKTAAKTTAKPAAKAAQNYTIPYAVAVQRADSVLKLMTLEEKVGQMVQYSDNKLTTGPESKDTARLSKVEKGEVGSMLNVIGAVPTRIFQDAAMKSRLRIPLIFGLDVVHGFRTISPLPLAEAASFDLKALENSARLAALEASAAGIHWTFAPMVDVSVDARWGRVMEGAGEDPFYGSLAAKARVKGFQGDNLYANYTLLACAKHFAAYGAPVAGKDYNSVDMSMSHFYNFYLLPYKAAAEAGVGTFMNAFNDFNNVPCTANAPLVQGILKGDWGFKGFVVSDWNSIGEMVAHRYAKDNRQAAEFAIKAGNDMDMETSAYHENLADLVRKGDVDIKLVDDAVRRILTKKFELGLFDDPYRYCDPKRQEKITLSKELRDGSRDMAKRSIVMLENKNNLLPLSAKVGSVALIGELNDSKEDMNGFWAGQGDINAVVTVKEALAKRGVKVNYASGYDLDTKKMKDLDAALDAARKSDVVIVAVGERAKESGEAKSMANIEISADHQKLVTELAGTGKPVVALVMGGRPMIFNTVRAEAGAVLLTWWLGTEAGNAICDVLFGDYNPSAKLPMTFPQSVGQVPIYYYYKSTGRPYNPKERHSTSYLDVPIYPAYPFGYGLSYTSFDISEPVLSHTITKVGQPVTVSVKVKNTGSRDGEEVVQMYVKDMVASITRPVKELKGFEKVSLKSGEEKTVQFTLEDSALGFYNNDLKFVVEPGDFEIMVGNSSESLKSATLKVILAPKVR